jgi:hypothetical protein
MLIKYNISFLQFRFFNLIKYLHNGKSLRILPYRVVQIVWCIHCYKIFDKNRFAKYIILSKLSAFEHDFLLY